MSQLRQLGIRAWPLAAVVALGCLVPASSHAQRDLHWPSIEVEAFLDSTGELHVRERQVIAFTGDWNGGERIFNVRRKQRLTFIGLTRVDPSSGNAVPLREDDLDAIDEYAWNGSRTLRWRSRLPSDPPFADTRLTYDLVYTLGNILVVRDSMLVLDHDFAFPDRNGVIERFSLTLTIDPAWRTPVGFTGSFVADSLEPGRGYVVTVPLHYAKAGPVPGVRLGAPRQVRLALLAGVALVVTLLTLRLWRRERALGRFMPLVPREQIDEAWLKQHVLHLPPEVVGALWDNHTAGPEVAAILARLIAEKKLSSEVKRVGWWKMTTDVLHLKLLVKRSALVGYERELISGLFEHGKTETNTASIRARYQKTGFDPTSTIRNGLEAIVGKPNPNDPDAPKPSPAPTIVLVLLGLALLIYGIRADALDAPWVAAVLASGVVAWIFAVSQAVYWRHRVFHLGRHSLRFFVPLAIPLGILAWLLWLNPERAGLPTLAGLTLLALGVANCVLNMARSRQGAERIAQRKQLAAAREYLRHELQQREPRLRDEWFPWLIAFELGRSMDRWFAAFGPTGQAVSRPSSTSFGSSPASTSASGTPSWSGFGGGGGFAGGGSSGSFSAAVGVMAAGVSKPSSSSSSGGDSSGGGSSGGGGGGGW